MRILIVEDNTEKLGRIVKVLVSISNIYSEDIDDCRDAISAKRILRDRKYDLLVIDIAIPERVTDGVLADGGIKLLEDIVETDVYVTPDHIIGITAHEELQDFAQRAFAEYDWFVIHYKPESEDWQEKLKRKAEHILSALKVVGSDRLGYQCDLAVICALPAPELAAVKKYLPWSWEQCRLSNDHGVYYKGQFAADGCQRSVVAAAAPRVGMSAAAVLATKMIYSFRPRFMAMVGISAGIRGAVSLGDVVIASECWDYGSGKVLQKDEETRLRIAPHQLGLGPDLLAKAQLVAEQDDWLRAIQDEWPGPKPNGQLRLRVGPMASGAAVLASRIAVASIVEQHRKLLAIEMEAYGVLSAAEEAPSPRPSALIIKSVCDFADEVKDDSMQMYAAYASARVLKYWAERWM